MKKLLIGITAILMISVPYLFAQNIIANGEFDDGATGWEGWINTGEVDVDVSVDTTGKLSGKNSYRLAVNEASATTYYIQRNIDCPIEFGHKYRVSLLAIATDAGEDNSSINVLLEENGGDYAKRMNEFATVTDEKTVFVFESDYSPATDPGNQLKLHFGGTVNTGDTIWVDSLVVEDIGITMDIVVDGIKDPFYGTLTGPDDGYVQLQAFHNNDQGIPEGNADLSAKVWGAWDDTWFYLYAEVTDDIVACPNTAAFYRNDALELKFDGVPDDSTQSSVSRTATLTALDSADAPEGAVTANLETLDDADKQYARGELEDGYTLELAIALDTLGGSEKINAAVGEVFGLGFHFVDNDGSLPSDNRSAAITWAAVCHDQIWNRPKYHGTVEFLADKKVKFIPTNNMTGNGHGLPYDGTIPEIVVDGEMDPFYKTLSGEEEGYVQVQTCHFSNQGMPVDNDDLSAKLWGAWDDTWFYLYAEILDDTVACPNATNFYRNDCLELKVDGVPDDSTQSSVTRTATLTALDSADAPEGAVIANLETLDDADKQYVRGELDDGYTLEMAIKLDTLGGSETIAAAVGEKFGLGINIVDNDGTEPTSNRQAAIIWAAVCHDDIWNTPKHHGTVEFLEDNKLNFIPTNNMTGYGHGVPYDGTPCPPISDVGDEWVSGPVRFNLRQNYPNPFNPTTTISYEIPSVSNVRLVVYDALGREVTTLVNEVKKAGTYEVTFDGKRFSSGMYFFKLDADSRTQVRKMMIIK